MNTTKRTLSSLRQPKFEKWQNRARTRNGKPWCSCGFCYVCFCYSALLLLCVCVGMVAMGEEGVRTHKYLQSSCVWLVKLTSAVTAPGLRNGLVATPSWRSPRMPHWLMAVLTSDVQIYIILFSFPSFSSSLSPRKRWWGFISRDEVEQLLISQHVSKCPVLTGIVCGVLIFVAYICGSGK